MIEKLNAVAAAHPGHPVFLLAASMGNRVCVEVLSNRADRLEANVADALICTGFPLYPKEPKTEAKKVERMEPLLAMKPSTSVLFCSGSKDEYLHRAYLALDARGLDAIHEVVEEMANKERVTVVEIEGGKHGVPSGTGYKKRKTTIENEAAHVASAIFNFCKQVERGVE